MKLNLEDKIVKEVISKHSKFNNPKDTKKLRVLYEEHSLKDLAEELQEEENPR